NNLAICDFSDASDPKIPTIKCGEGGISTYALECDFVLLRELWRILLLIPLSIRFNNLTWR
ncbi:MAG: hypothetical protein ABIJ40_17950, partial [Bacteroidota bacterium]